MEKYVIEKTVTEDMLAVNVGSGSLRVLATPVVAAMMEEASAKLAQELLSGDMTTVGVSLEIKHLSPSPAGAVITVQSVLTKHEGRSFEFEVRAFDNAGEIANGRHGRVSVFSEKFQKKADSKFV